MGMSIVNAKHTEHVVRGAKQVNNAEGNQDGFAISTLKKILEEGGHDMGLVSVNCVTGHYRFGGYVYGRWKQKIQVGKEGL